MESLIKKKDLIKCDYVKNNPLIRTPKGFVEVFDKWKDNEGKKNNTEISRSFGFKVFKEILPFVSIDINKRKEINLKLKETNLKIK